MMFVWLNPVFFDWVQIGQELNSFIISMGSVEIIKSAYSIRNAKKTVNYDVIIIVFMNVHTKIKLVKLYSKAHK
jgi:hypothetical protein